MNVSELIDALKQFPPHHTVMVEYPDVDMTDTGLKVRVVHASVADLRAHTGCTVIVDAMGGVL